MELYKIAQLVCSLFILLIYSSINADNQFRGGYLTYLVDNEGDLNYGVTVNYASAWKIGPTACVGDTTNPDPQATSVRLQSLIIGEGLRTSPSSLVQCTSTSTDLTTRFGTNTWVISNLRKDDFYFLIYNINTAWLTFPCCPEMSGISADQSIRLQTSLPTAALTPDSLNNPPQFSELLLIEIPSGQTITYTVPTTDPESDDIRCRLPNQSEAGALALITSPHATITTGCSFTIDATSKPAGEYPIAFMVEDFSSPTSVIPLHSVPYQIVFFVTSTSTTNSIDANVICTRNNMRIEIPISEFTVGTAPATDKVVFSGQTDPSCASQIVGDKYVLSSSLNQCGTAFENQDATHINYVNTVVIGSAIIGTITRSFTGVQIKVRCKYRSDYSSENDKSYIANSLVSSEEENFGQFTIILRAYDATYTNAITQFPMSVDLSARQYCQIDVTDNNDDTVVIAERIFASTSASRLSGLTHNLIINRCPNEFDSTVQLNNLASTRSQFRFSFEAFVFSSNAADQVYIHCDTFLCHQNSNNDRCNTVCPLFTGRNANNVARITANKKKRREIGNYSNRTIDVDQPSRVYFLVAGPYVLEKEDGYERVIQNQNNDRSFWSREFIIVIAAVIVAIVAASAMFYVAHHKKTMMRKMTKLSAGSN